jgi:hypothetical protein
MGLRSVAQHVLGKGGEAEDQQQGGAVRDLAGLEGRHGQGAEGEEFADGNEDHTGDREHQHQCQRQQHVDRPAGNAVLGQDGENR